MGIEKKLSNHDVNQIHQYLYNEELNASRVEIVGFEGLKIEPKIDLGTLEHTLASQKELKIERIEIPVPIHTTETKVETIQVPVVIKEVQIEKIEVPTIIKEIQIVEVEKVVYQDRIVKVEVPVIVKEIEYKEIEKPLIFNSNTGKLERKSIDIVQIVQVLILFGMFIKLLLIK